MVTSEPSFPPPGSQSIDQILQTARAKLRRIGPTETYSAQCEGAALVDIRPAAQRLEHGEIPGSLVVERNVLEWRFDPRCDARLPIADRYDLPVVVFCQEGYTSSLAAAALHDVGLHRATDMDGGFAAWRAAGLPLRDRRSLHHDPLRQHVDPRWATPRR